MANKSARYIVQYSKEYKEPLSWSVISKDKRKSGNRDVFEEKFRDKEKANLRAKELYLENPERTIFIFDKKEPKNNRWIS